MLNHIDENWTQGTHITFRNNGNYWGGQEHKTNCYEVVERGNIRNVLGLIRWFPRWRKYVFAPCTETVYEETCMGEISEFIVTKTKAHKEKAKINAAV
jgi:hypothetical protein